MKLNRAIFPSNAAISIAAKKVELADANIIPFETFSTASGEGVKFKKLPNVIQTIIRAHGLHETAERRQVEFGVSINATHITKNIVTYDDDADADRRWRDGPKIQSPFLFTR
jgi:hypothetical protein